jgi:hypothetical protein
MPRIILADKPMQRPGTLPPVSGFSFRENARQFHTYIVALAASVVAPEARVPICTACGKGKALSPLPQGWIPEDGRGWCAGTPEHGTYRNETGHSVLAETIPLRKPEAPRWLKRI